MLQVVNKKTQSVLLTFSIFHVLFQDSCSCICLLGEVFQGFEKYQWLFQKIIRTSQKIIQMKTYSKSNIGMCSMKKMFTNISQNSQENICAKASFLTKLPGVCNFIKKEALAQVFLHLELDQKSLRKTILKTRLFKVTNKGKPPRMFSLA